MGQKCVLSLETFWVSTSLASQCFDPNAFLFYITHTSPVRERISQSSCGTPVSKAVNWLFYSLKHRMKWLFSLCESSMFLGARVRFCARAKKVRVLGKRFPLAHYFKAGAICTNSYSIYTVKIAGFSAIYTTYCK